MRVYLKIISIAITTTLLWLVPLKILLADEFLPEIQPTPEYLPAEVVGIQMRALANNNQPFDNAGIQLTFRFASPSNKVSTGPLSRFSNLFNNPAYQPMIDHSLLKIGDAEIRQDRAKVPVMIEARNGSRMVYLFMLSRQTDAPYQDCWMTDSVTPVKIKEPDQTTVM
ncbi:MAG: DUF4864 domain-containing protein [bacterium]